MRENATFLPNRDSIFGLCGRENPSAIFASQLWRHTFLPFLRPAFRLEISVSAGANVASFSRPFLVWSLRSSLKHRSSSGRKRSREVLGKIEDDWNGAKNYPKDLRSMKLKLPTSFPQAPQRINASRSVLFEPVGLKSSLFHQVCRPIDESLELPKVCWMKEICGQNWWCEESRKEMRIRSRCAVESRELYELRGSKSGRGDPKLDAVPQFWSTQIVLIILVFFVVVGRKSKLLMKSRDAQPRNKNEIRMKNEPRGN